MLAIVQIYDDNNAITGKYVICPINVIDNGLSTEYQFAFTYNQLNCQHTLNITDVSTINGVNVDGGVESR